MSLYKYLSIEDEKYSALSGGGTTRRIIITIGKFLVSRFVASENGIAERQMRNLVYLALQGSVANLACLFVSARDRNRFRSRCASLSKRFARQREEPLESRTARNFFEKFPADSFDAIFQREGREISREISGMRNVRTCF